MNLHTGDNATSMHCRAAYSNGHNEEGPPGDEENIQAGGEGGFTTWSARRPDRAQQRQYTFNRHSMVAVASRVFVVEQFGIRHWKANGKTNLMISKHLKIGRLQPKKSRNMFE